MTASPPSPSRDLGLRWIALRDRHRAAVTDFATAADRVAASAWREPMADGKWSPAQLTVHLMLACEVQLRELETGVGPRIVTSWWVRLLLRFTVRRRLLSGDRFPEGVRSPREVRPGNPSEDQPTTIARFRDAARRLETAIEQTMGAHPRAQLTHPYLGGLSLSEALRFNAVHVRHHLRQLEAAHPLSAG
ncbi:MAG TPA: DinB family protein [Gemmatimonadaceae bacterium]|nr:DinB family protein [Gemmatimonadaceae bacterium]